MMRVTIIALLLPGGIARCLNAARETERGYTTERSLNYCNNILEDALAVKE
jgi:hypothetical protein